MKSLMLAAMALSALAMRPAFADGGDVPATTTFTMIQEAQQRAAHPGQDSPRAAEAEAGHAYRGSRLIGTPIYNGRGERIGQIQDVLVRDAARATLVVSVGDFLGQAPRLVAVPMNHVRLRSDVATMPDATRQHLAGMPVFVFPPSDGVGG